MMILESMTFHRTKKGEARQWKHKIISFEKIYFYRRGVIVESVISYDGSMMKDLLKHSFQDIKDINNRFSICINPKAS